MTAERATFDAALARAGLIVPTFVEVVEADETDPDGWYDMLDVTTMASGGAWQIKGTWHGRVTRRTELVWHWLDTTDLTVVR